MKCDHCQQPCVEIKRNEYYVFYKCGCNRHKDCLWDWKTMLHDGQEIVMGSAGSIAHICPNCKRHTYRQSQFSNEICLFCGKCEIEPLTVAKLNELMESHQ